MEKLKIRRVSKSEEKTKPGFVSVFTDTCLNILCTLKKPLNYQRAWKNFAIKVEKKAKNTGQGNKFSSLSRSAVKYKSCHSDLT